MDKRRREKKDPSGDFIKMICDLYGDTYDDREEDSSPGGADWIPGTKAKHASLAAFQKELMENGIELSTAKIRKILITGGCWTTERSREVAELYEKYRVLFVYFGHEPDPIEKRHFYAWIAIRRTCKFNSIFGE